MTQDQIDHEALNPKPGIWKVGDKEYRMKPPKLRHMGALMLLQKAFEPLQPKDDVEVALTELTDEQLAGLKKADYEFEEMILELADGMDKETLDEIGFAERISALEVLTSLMGSADDKGLEAIGAKRTKKGGQ